MCARTFADWKLVLWVVKIHGCEFEGYQVCPHANMHLVTFIVRDETLQISSRSTVKQVNMLTIGIW